jgi:hypothetical protein
MTSGFKLVVPNLWTFDRWANGSMKLVGEHRMPLLEPVTSIPSGVQLIPYDKSQQSAACGTSVVHFYINDDRFSSVTSDPANAMPRLSRFGGVIGPDISPYATHNVYMRATSLWYGKAVTALWQGHGIKTIPNVRWLFDDDLDYALCGVPSESVLSISTLGVASTTPMRACLRRGVRRIINEKHPVKLLVHGVNREDIFGEFLGSTEIEFFQPRIYSAFAASKESHG